MSEPTLRPKILKSAMVGNIQGLYIKSNQSKIPLLADLTHQEDFLFIALTASHFNDNILDVEVKINNYTSFTTDKQGRSHGGIITYIINDLASSAKSLLSLT